MPSTDPSTSALTSLLTLVNVSAAKPNKRKRARVSEPGSPSRRKLGHAHRRALHAAQEGDVRMSKKELLSVKVGEAMKDLKKVERESETIPLERSASIERAATTDAHSQIRLADDVESDAESDSQAPAGTKVAAVLDLDGFEIHFGSHGDKRHAEVINQLYPTAKEGSVRELEWQDAHGSADESVVKALGKEVSRSMVKGFDSAIARPHANAHTSLLKARKGAPFSPSQSALANVLGSHADLLDTRALDRKAQKDRRQVLALHAMSHLIKTRRKILRNNERLAKASSEGRSIDVPRDQGYTRPTLLVLSPFRSSAYVWVQALFAASGLETLSGSDRLSSDFGPDPSVALSSEELPDKPKDFVQTFAGNTDDNFRFGIQLKRKEMRLWTGWYASDVILASPLGLRLALQKDGDADFLSSIEMLVVDQAEVMSMQNWDHVQHVLSRTSQIPQASHDTDFSRVRQWYLDDRALNLRQTILLSSYDMPELRAIYRGLTNVAGKNRSGHTFEGVLGGVREGLRQTFTRFDCANLNMEPDARFQHFTSRTLPSLLKSAVGATKTVIFVPSYFDFVRVEDHMKRSDLSFEAISEYSTPREVAQSRQAFFTGKRAFLIVTERSHFYKRNTYRGAQTLVFYALPENALFYSEILHWPFVPPKPRVGKDGRMKEISKEELENAKLDPTEVAALAVFSKFDRFRLERIVGDRQAARMITEERSNWKFA